MSFDDVDPPQPADTGVLIKIEAAGINYIDTYQRSIRIKWSPYRTAFHSTKARRPCCRFVPRITCHNPPTPLRKGDSCLIHAAAGGMGLILTQMAKNAGATVIGTVSTQEKAELARAAGADEVILYCDTDFETEVMRITDGAGVNVVYDSVGKTTFDKGIECLQRFGYMVLYGNASGPVTEFNPATLGPKGSLFLTRPTLFDYTADRESLEWRTGDVFKWIDEGELSLRLEHFFSLADAREAHQALDGRKTTGKIILTP